MGKALLIPGKRGDDGTDGTAHQALDKTQSVRDQKGQPVWSEISLR